MRNIIILLDFLGVGLAVVFWNLQNLMQLRWTLRLLLINWKHNLMFVVFYTVIIHLFVLWRLVRKFHHQVILWQCLMLHCFDLWHLCDFAQAAQGDHVNAVDAALLAASCHGIYELIRDQLLGFLEEQCLQILLVI